MVKKQVNELVDSAAERLVISALIQYGTEIFHDINSLVDEQFFFHPENKLIYSVVKSLILEQGINKPGIASILTLINSVDKEAIQKFELTRYLTILSDSQVTKEEYKPFLEKIVRLGYSRNLIHRLKLAIENIEQSNGQKSVLQLIRSAEEPVVDFTETLINQEDVINLTDYISAYVEQTENNAGKMVGIPTGFPCFDAKIGGGLRYPGVHLIGARTGIGKSQMCLNIAHNVSSLGIPVLYLDTELTKEQTLGRWLARTTNIPISEIETGNFANNPSTKRDLITKSNVVIDKKQPFYYYNISGKSHEEWLSIARRWIMKIVGFDENGKTKPCLVIYDYIKLMNTKELGSLDEYQYLGQVTTDLHNFCVKYNIASLATVQLNRDGVSGEDTSVIAASDRIGWLVSSFSILKNKQESDYADTNNGPNSGNKKLIIPKARFGSGTDFGEYINLKCDLSRAKIVEGNTNIVNRSIRSDLIDTSGEMSANSVSYIDDGEKVKF